MRGKHETGEPYIYNQFLLNGFRCRPKGNTLFIKTEFGYKWASFNADGTVAIPPGVSLNTLKEMIEAYDMYIERMAFKDDRLSIDERVKKLKPPRPQWKGKKVAA